MVKSPLFVRYVANHPSPKIERPIVEMGKREQREDKEAELETLRTTKMFLTEKLKQNEEVIKLL